MKKIYAIIITICIFWCKANAQEKDSIIYIFPDKVEKLFYEYIQTYSPDETFDFHLVTRDDKYKLFVTTGDKNNYWGNNTNRFILINDKKYPLTFDYDCLFSTENRFDIGQFGQREGYILRSWFIIEGYNITFDRYGFDVTESWGIFKKIDNK